MRTFNAGDIVKHFKRELVDTNKDPLMYLYEIIGISTHTETKEKLMTYRALYGDRTIYVRPLEMFLSEVDKEKYPNIKQKYRFELLNTSEEE